MTALRKECVWMFILKIVLFWGRKLQKNTYNVQQSNNCHKKNTVNIQWLITEKRDCFQQNNTHKELSTNVWLKAVLVSGIAFMAED